MATIVFDLDGTLVHSAPDIHAAANAVLAGEGVPPLSLAEATGFVGRGAPVFIDKMCAARGFDAADQPRLLAAFLKHYETAVGLSELYPNVLDALASLQADGHALGLCTNKPLGPTRAVLDHFDLARFFPVVYGGDSLAVKKPDPAPLLASFEALPAGKRLFVGDSEVDAETADRAGEAFILFTEGYRQSPTNALPHTALMEDFAALPALVDQLTAA